MISIRRNWGEVPRTYIEQTNACHLSPRSYRPPVRLVVLVVLVVVVVLVVGLLSGSNWQGTERNTKSSSGVEYWELRGLEQPQKGVAITNCETEVQQCLLVSHVLNVRREGRRNQQLWGINLSRDHLYPGNNEQYGKNKRRTLQVEFEIRVTASSFHTLSRFPDRWECTWNEETAARIAGSCCKIRAVTFINRQGMRFLRIPPDKIGRGLTTGR